MKTATRVAPYAVLPLCIMAVSLRPGSTVAASVATPHNPVQTHLLSVLPNSASFAFAMQATPAPGKSASEETPIPDGKGKDVTKRVCTGCHTSEFWASQRHTREEWSAVIDAMISKGLEASSDDLETINTYLATYLGPKQKKDPPPADSGK